ncbi:MAG: hypothetical protein IM568_11820 [Flavobacterium sp.]|nr:hypothetical protein [Flavobacterium sp.]
MQNTTTQTTRTNAAELLYKFAHQRPRLEYCNYGDPTSYRRESREITKDLHDFTELFALANWKISNLCQKIERYLKSNSGRLTMNEQGKIEYCTGQYFPTEYRPAASRILVSLLWNQYREDMPNADGNEIRKAIQKRVSRRVKKYYFN